MRVGIDQTWNQHFSPTIDRLASLMPSARAHLLNGSIIVHADKGVSEDVSSGVLGDDPVAIFQEESHGSMPLTGAVFGSGFLLKACKARQVEI